MNKVAKMDVPAEDHQPMVAMIERVVMDPDIPIEKLERMLDLKERHDAQSAKAAFAEAFATASEQFPDIPLNGKGHNGKKYALLKDITRLTRPILSAHGLALTFSIDTGDRIKVTAELMHKSGHTKSTSIDLPADNSGSKNAVQAVGSSQTYGQRYTAQAILGLSLGDDTEDDGGAAGGNQTVSAEQFITLRDKLEESGMPELKFHTAFGHNNPEHADLQQFPAAKFNDAMARLKKYMEAKADG